MRSVFKYIESVADSPREVLITGETGAGKELFANAIHMLSRREGKFVPVNIAGLDDNMFSDTLFGHIKGAFTDASSDRAGLIEMAEKGTLFLDEIGDLDKSSQLKLLRLLEEKKYYTLGEDTEKTADVRIVVATNANLQSKIQKNSF